MSEERSGRRRAGRRSRADQIRLWVVGVCLAGVLTVGGLAVQEYSAPPTGAKDCALHALPEPAELAARRTSGRYPGELTNRAGTVNDASCLNRTPVYGVAHPR